MSDVMKGNFKPQKPVKVNEQEEDLTTKFEREALKRLGGSIAFVSKKKFIYEGNKKGDPSVSPAQNSPSGEKT